MGNNFHHKKTYKYQRFIATFADQKKNESMSKKKQTVSAKPKITNELAIEQQSIPTRVLMIGCLILTFVVFANVLGASFVNWDDHGYLWLNNLIQPLSSNSLGAMFTGHTCGNYSPLVVLSYSIEHAFDTIVKPGEQVMENFNPFTYHLTNVLLHLGTTALAFVFLRMLGLKQWALAFATLLFGIHPMRAESVAWVTERKDVLYGLFYISALITYWKYQHAERRKGLFYGLTLLFGVLSLFSKIQAVSLPLSMLALDYFSGRDLKKVNIWLEKLPFFALSLVFGLIGIHFLGVAEGLKDAGYPAIDRLFFASYSLFNYLYKLVVPVGLSAYYPYPDIGATPVFYYITPFILGGLGWLVWRSAGKHKALAFGALFFLLNIMFVLQFKGAGKAFLADRFTYIPYLGLFFVLGHYYQEVSEGRLWPGLQKTIPIVAIAFAAICAFLTFRQNQTWQTSVSLWENVTSQYPKDALSWTNKGLAHHDVAEYENSMQAYQQAIKVNPSYYDGAHNLAVALHNLKRYPEAIQAFTTAIQIKPESPEGYFSRGQEYATNKEFGKAVADYEKAKQLGHKKPVYEIDYLIGIALAGSNQHDRAIQVYDGALKLHPDADGYYHKGNSLAALGNMQEAIAAYDAALKLKPDFGDVLNNKGNALASMGRFQEALPVFDQTIKVQPNAANCYFNRGMVKNSLGDKSGACTDWQKALEMGYSSAQQVIGQFCR